MIRRVAILLWFCWLGFVTISALCSNAALALSPVTDARFVSPSIRGNLDSDVILRPLAKRLAWVPGFMIGLAGRFMAGHRASDPVVSPLLGDLAWSATDIGVGQ